MDSKKNYLVISIFLSFSPLVKDAAINNMYARIY